MANYNLLTSRETQEAPNDTLKKKQGRKEGSRRTESWIVFLPGKKDDDDKSY